MKEIKLHSKKYPGLIALVDNEDYEWLNQYKWYPRKSCNTYYATMNVYRDGRSTRISMHQLITGFTFSRIDHEDRNGLNCQKYNLRDGSGFRNQANRSKSPGRSSQFKGVCWFKRDQKWMASIRINKRSKHLGLFARETDAARAYDTEAIAAFGKFALTNAMLGLLPIDQ